MFAQFRLEHALMRRNVIENVGRLEFFFLSSSATPWRGLPIN